ncbi:hypothetical protein G6W55_32225 [Streptomyces sp. CAI-85]|nr:hypothetical protein [Streptomyces sp. CAI-85]
MRRPSSSSGSEGVRALMAQCEVRVVWSRPGTSCGDQQRSDSAAASRHASRSVAEAPIPPAMRPQLR